jgi:hypothetical protein
MNNFKEIKVIKPSEDEDNIAEVKAMVTQLIHQVKAGPDKQLEQDQLQELDKTVGTELERVEENIWKLEKERDKLDALARTYKKDVV